MDSPFNNISLPRLKMLLDEETRNFINALDENKNAEEVKKIRARIKEIMELLKICKEAHP